MIIRRDWPDDLYLFRCAEVLDRHGIQIVAILPPGPHSPSWQVWGQAAEIDYDRVDREVDALIDSR